MTTANTPAGNPELKQLSLERVVAAFDEFGWKYDLHPESQALRTGFSGIGMEIKFLAPNVSIVSTVAVDVITADRYEEVRAWVEDYNLRNAFPSASAFRDTQRDLAALGATFAIPGYWDYTDEQFEAHLSSGIQGVVNCARDFLGHFAPDVLKHLDSANAGAGTGEA